MNTAKELIRRYEELRARRQPWEGHWQELADYVLPRRADITERNVPGNKRTQRLFDGTAMDANELLAAGLHGMMTSPATQWFELGLQDAVVMKEQDVRAWLDDTARRMHAALGASNFQTEVHELYLDLGCFGTAAMFVEDNVEQGLRFSTRPLNEIFLAQNADGAVDTVFRRFSYTVRQAVQRWGADKVGPRILKLLQKTPNAELSFLHAVLPRAERVVTRRDSLNHPFLSIYIDVEGEQVLAEAGFHEFPYMVPRWSKAAGEIFGRSPAMKALPDIKMLNEMCKTTIKAAQKVVDPPLLVADDGVMLPVRTTPASLNYARFLADGGDPIRPLQTNANVGLGLQMEESRRSAVRRAFFADHLQIAASPQMTATEVLQRAEEKLRVLGPMIGRLQSEFLSPLIRRVYGIMARSGRLAPPPAYIANVDMELVYVSPIARAQRATEAQGLLRLIEIASPLARFQPDLVDNIDGDAALRHLWSLFSVPQTLLRSPADVAVKRSQRVQAEALSELATPLMEGLGVPDEGDSDA